MMQNKVHWLLLAQLVCTSAWAFKPDSRSNDSLEEKTKVIHARGLKNLASLQLGDLLEAGESLSSRKIALKGASEKRVLERLNRRLAKNEGEVKISQVQEDGLGNRHIRVLQYYKGIPVIGTDMVIHVNDQNQIYGVGGNSMQGLNLDIQTQLTPDSAVKAVIRGLKLGLKSKLSLESRPDASPKQVLYDGKLAYEVIQAGDNHELWQCYVDARTGEILSKVNRILHAAPVGGSPANVHGLILADEGGTDENVNGWLDTRNQYFLHNSENKWGVFDEDAADWEQQPLSDWSATDRAAMSLGNNIARTQDYVKNVLMRNSYDNRGAFAKAIVHVDVRYVNAYWDGTALNFGDGDGITANALTVMDVVAHEYGHAITEYTSNLNYYGESGALNESYSDILGTLVEFHTQADGRSAYPNGINGRADWLMGEDCWLSEESLRDMRNPMRYGQPSYYGGTYWHSSNDVHVNSGVQNFALYLLSEGGNASNDGHAYNISGLGIVAAGKIALYANMYLLTSTSNYRDARAAWILAAQTLGYDAATVSAVWTACGIAPMESHLAVLPANLSFGPIGVGETAILPLVLSNNGGVATQVNALTFSNALFSSAIALPFSVPAGGSLTIPIRFRPTTFMSHSGTAILSSNAVDNPELSISLSGNGVSAPEASLSPTAMSFALSPLHAPADQTASLTNLGEANLTYSVSLTEASRPSMAGLGDIADIAAKSILPKKNASIINPDLIYKSSNYAQAFVPNQVLVAFKLGKTSFAKQGMMALAQDSKELAVAKNPASGLRMHTGRKIILVQLPSESGPTVSQAIEILRQDGNVEYVEPNYIRKMSALPNDPNFGSLYGMHNTGQSGGSVDADIDAPEAWDHFTGNKSLILGLIDTGIDYLHPDLAANIWTNVAEQNGMPGIDDDANGYIDDLHGYDFINNDSDPMDDHGHGTHCAGTIAGIGNNSLGVAGVVWDANIAGLKIFNSSGSTTDAAILNAIDYSNAMGMRITSNSWGGGPYSQSIYDLIEEGQGLGHLFIAAAGNYGENTDIQPNYPSGYNLENIISVAATDRYDVLASFSNYGPSTVDLAAPGEGILSCQPGARYQTMSGTSMATPHVSGAAYLVWSYKPSLTAMEVKRILLSSVDLKSSLTGRMGTGGRLNIARALTEAGPLWLTASPSAGLVRGGESGPITVTVNPAGLAMGQWNGRVNVATNDSLHPILSIQVTANIAGCKNVTLMSTSLDFGRVLVGATETRSLILRNNCNEATEVSGLSINEPTYTTNSVAPFTLAPMGESRVNILFRPTSAGSIPGELRLISEDALSPIQSLPLRAIGVLGPILRTSSPEIVSQASPGQQVQSIFTLQNEGDQVLDWSISGVRVSTSGYVEPVYGPEHFIPLQKGKADARIGNPVLTSSGGPDSFGYSWIDSDQRGGPAYSWNDIKLTGTRLATVSNCDDCYQNHPFSFGFPFYGETYTSLFVSSNGILTFGGGTNQYTNYPLPSISAPAALISPFHKDLDPGSSGDIFIQDFGNKLIVQFENIAAYNGSGNYTFQVEFRIDGTITYYYKMMNGTLTGSTVGIQNQSRTIGLTTAYNQTYLKNNLAVRYASGPVWLSLSASAGSIAPGFSQDITVTMNALNLPRGVYFNSLSLQHNGSTPPNPLLIPVTFNVRRENSGRKRLRRIGAGVLASSSGTQYKIRRMTIGGETVGLQRSSHYHLKLH